MIHTTAGYLFYAAVGLVIYLYSAYCIREIARKRALPRPWYAWVPVLQVYLLSRIVGKRFFWTVLLFLPFIDIVFVAITFVKMARVLHHNRWYGLLLLVPVVNLFVLWDLAFGLRQTWEAAVTG